MNIIRKIFRKILSISLQPILKRYLDSPRNYSYQDLKLRIAPGVFHPGFFFSTTFLLDHLKALNLHEKSFLELGAGSGLLSFYANTQGAQVTASDISETVLSNITFNQQVNHQKFRLIHSNLFKDIPAQKFDIIVINPPYYKRNPKTDAEYAWYCGEGLDYFYNLFQSLRDYILSESVVLMVLSEDCDVSEIKSIAAKNNFTLKEIKRKRIWMEENYIFQLKSNR